MSLLEKVQRLTPIIWACTTSNLCSYRKMERSILVQQPKQMLQRSERAADIRTDLNSVKLIPINAPCSPSHSKPSRSCLFCLGNLRCETCETTLNALRGYWTFFRST